MDTPENPASHVQEPDAERDPVVGEILCDFYHEDKIITQSVEQLAPNEYQITYIFPPYERTKVPLGHVSMVQMHEAILEGLYCTIGSAIKAGFIETSIDFQTFQQLKPEFLYFEENLKFRRLLQPGEPAQLMFTILAVEDIRLVKQFHSVRVGIRGFISGEVNCLLEKQNTGMGSEVVSPSP
jgi:hypothetical protein